jgi:hypothetical protein
MTENNDDYKVGYQKPPLHTRVKPGERKNPHGRPKGSKNVNTLIEKVMNAPATIRENGKTRKVSRTELIIARQIKKAVEEGDTRAAQYLLDKKTLIDAAKAASGVFAAPVTSDDQELLRDFIRRTAEDEKAKQTTRLDETQKENTDE